MADVKVSSVEGGINRKWLRKHCDSIQGCYDTPALNNKLMLQHQSLLFLDNLDEYVNVSWLYLQNNALESIENIGHMKKLTGLYLSQNEIHQFKNLDKHPKLQILSVDKNLLEDLEGIEVCRCLEQFSACDNMIRDISHLKHVKSLSTLKLNRNKLADAKEVIDVLKQLPNLKTLYLKGNPFVRKLKDYRKEIIHACPSLEFLDDRPVYDWEKKFVSAWKIGGKEGLEKERERHNKEKWGAVDRNMIKWKQARMEMKAKLDAERAAEEKRKKNEETQNTAPRIKMVEIVDFEEGSDSDKECEGGNAKDEKDSKSRKPEPTVEYKRTLADLQADPILECKSQWSPEMDRTLLQSCQKFNFDFDRIADSLQGTKSFCNKITALECRCRMLELDRLEHKRSQEFEVIDCFDPDDLNWDVELMPWTSY